MDWFQAGNLTLFSTSMYSKSIIKKSTLIKNFMKGTGGNPWLLGPGWLLNPAQPYCHSAKSRLAAGMEGRVA